MASYIKGEFMSECETTNGCTGECTGEEIKTYTTFDYVSNFTPDQCATAEAIREKFKELNAMIYNFPFAGSKSFSDRCLSIAHTRLEEACMWAIKAMCFDGKEVAVCTEKTCK